MNDYPFTKERQTAASGPTQVVRGHPLKKWVRTAGGEVYVEEVYKPTYTSYEDWLQDLEVPPSRMSGFGSFLKSLGEDPNRWALGSAREPLQESYLDEKVPAFTEGLTNLEKKRLEALRVNRDALGVPDNFSMIDRDSETQVFFGDDKPDELEGVRERVRQRDRAVEQHDYAEGERPKKPPFKARPLKFLVKE